MGERRGEVGLWRGRGGGKMEWQRTSLREEEEGSSEFSRGGKESWAKGKRREASVRPRDEEARRVLRGESAGRSGQGAPFRVRRGAVQGQGARRSSKGIGGASRRQVGSRAAGRRARGARGQREPLTVFGPAPSRPHPAPGSWAAPAAPAPAPAGHCSTGNFC